VEKRGDLSVNFMKVLFMYPHQNGGQKAVNSSGVCVLDGRKKGAVGSVEVKGKRESKMAAGQ